MHKTLLAAASATALAVGLAVAATSPVQAAPAPAAARTAQYVPPPISWGACTNATLTKIGAQCGTLVVPLVYANPRGTKIRLAVSRLLHKAGTKYQGVMLTNPGGPGGSGLVLPVLAQYVPNGAGDGYDWIGFDPRGVGDSRPTLSCDPSWVAPPRPPYAPSTGGILNYWLNKSARYAKACTFADNAELFRHVRTVDNVADMESIRIALGQKQINYYGFSYGTYLGEVYATLHPNRVRRFVWDGVMNPQRVFYKSNLDQDVAFQKTFDIYFTWLAKYHSVYHVGNTYAQVRSLFLKTQAALDRHPAKGVLGGDELLDVFTNAGYYVYGWESIAQEYSAYIVKHDPSGLIADYNGANSTAPGGDNEFALYLGTQCTDAPWPKNTAQVLADNVRYNRTYNYFTWSNGWFNGPCNYWHYKASTPVNVTGKSLRVPILLIAETYDAATPFEGALVTRSLFPTASLIEGYHGSTHAGSLSGVQCTDDTIARYLTDGSVPKRKPSNRSDEVCPPVPQPDPTAVSPQSRTAGSSSAAVLRAALEAAQLH